MPTIRDALEHEREEYIRRMSELEIMSEGVISLASDSERQIFDATHNTSCLVRAEYYNAPEYYDYLI